MIEATALVHGFVGSRLLSRDPRRALIRRPWTRAERSVVLHGVAGRMCIAIEPILCGTVFTILTIGMFVVRTDPTRPTEHNMVILAPIFAIGVLASIAHAIALLRTPFRALRQTFRPIYIVDGYIRHRTVDTKSPEGTNGYVAVLDESSRPICEWHTLGTIPLAPLMQPARTEFSEYGGIHRIDGRRTGVLPEKINSLGVGIASRRSPIA